MLTGRTHQGTPFKQLAGIARRPQMKTWVIVANRFGANFFRKITGKPLEAVGTLKNHYAENLDRFRKSDRAGRSFDSFTNAHKGQTGTARHAMTEAIHPQELASKAFSESIADIIRVGRVGRKFQRFILIAEPKMMGRLHKALDPKSRRMLIHSIPKNFAHASERELLSRVEELCQDSNA